MKLLSFPGYLVYKWNRSIKRKIAYRKISISIFSALFFIVLFILVLLYLYLKSGLEGTINNQRDLINKKAVEVGKVIQDELAYVTYIKNIGKNTHLIKPEIRPITLPYQNKEYLLASSGYDKLKTFTIQNSDTTDSIDVKFVRSGTAKTDQDEHAYLFITFTDDDIQRRNGRPILNDRDHFRLVIYNRSLPTKRYFLVYEDTSVDTEVLAFSTTAEWDNNSYNPSVKKVDRNRILGQLFFDEKRSSYIVSLRLEINDQNHSDFIKIDNTTTVGIERVNKDKVDENIITKSTVSSFIEKEEEVIDKAELHPSNPQGIIEKLQINCECSLIYRDLDSEFGALKIFDQKKYDDSLIGYILGKFLNKLHSKGRSDLLVKKLIDDGYNKSILDNLDRVYLSNFNKHLNYFITEYVKIDSVKHDHGYLIIASIPFNFAVYEWIDSVKFIAIATSIVILLILWIAVYIWKKIVKRLSDFTKLLKEYESTGNDLEIKKDLDNDEISFLYSALRQGSRRLNRAKIKLENTNQQIKRKNKSIEKLYKHRYKMTALLGHNIKTPAHNLVNMIKGHEENKERQHLKIKNAATAIQNLYDGKILDSKIEAENIANYLESTLKYNSEVKLVINTNDKTALVDINYLGEILDNLISNASDFKYSGSKVLISLISDHEYLVIKAKNHGPQIDILPLENIFNYGVSTRLSDIFSDDYHSGLGLFSSRDYAIRMGGDLTVTNEADGPLFSLSLLKP